MNSFITQLAHLSIYLTAVALPMLFGTLPAMASRTCKDVFLQVKNETGNKVKIIDLDYYDPAAKKWRSEPVPNEEIPDGRPWQETRNLEKVNQMNIRIRVDYRVPKGNGWSSVLTKESSPRKVCSKGKEYTITLTESDTSED